MEKQNIFFLFLMCTQQTEFNWCELPFEIRTRKIKLSLKSMVSGLYLVLITECEDLGIPGCLLCQSCRIMAGLFFMGTEKPYLHIFCYSML